MFAIGGLCLLLWLAVVNASNSSEVRVGSGKYALKDGKVTLSDEFGIYDWRTSFIVPEHLYPNCSVKIYNDTISLWYNAASKEVCTVDLLTDRDDIEFTTSLTLCDDNKKEDLKDPIVLPFAYSLNNKEVNEIKNGPLYGKDNASCPNREGCKSFKSENWTEIPTPDCMPWTALEIEWRCKHDLEVDCRSKPAYAAKVYFIGEMAGYVTHFSIEDFKEKVSFTVKINKTGGVDSGGLVIDGIPSNTTSQQNLHHFTCIKFSSIIKPKAWKIDGNVKDEIKVKKLMTFHLLPRSASRARTSDNQFYGKLPDIASSKECRRGMSIRFNRTDYELLERLSKVVEANSSTTTTTVQPSTNSTATNETNNQKPTDSTTPNATIPTNETETTAANKSSEVPPTNSSSPPSVNTTSKPEQNNETLPQSSSSNASTVQTSTGGSNGTTNVGTSPSMNYSTFTQNFTSTISVNETNGTSNSNLTTSTKFSTSMPTIILKTTTSTKLPSITNGTTKGIKGKPKVAFPSYYFYIVGGGGAVVILL
ncbi:unnamed protein product [Meloidogyne enterolobii]|uniref:Uncharacterized protein n=1 Tax=Meloidogyne enterolobii TaxID=390850 RepID=A0ACB0ZPH4_MELEN